MPLLAEGLARGMIHGPEDFERPAIGIYVPPAYVPPEPIDYRAISAVIQELPRSRAWSAEHRERWLAAMAAVVDLLIEVQP